MTLHVCDRNVGLFSALALSVRLHREALSCPLVPPLLDLLDIMPSDGAETSQIAPQDVVFISAEEACGDPYLCKAAVDDWEEYEYSLSGSYFAPLRRERRTCRTVRPLAVALPFA